MSTLMAATFPHRNYTDGGKSLMSDGASDRRGFAFCVLDTDVMVKRGLANSRTSAGGSIEGSRVPPLREIFTCIYLPTINKLLSFRNKSTKIHSVYPRLIG